MTTKLTDSDVAAKLLTIQFKLRGLAHLLEYHRLDTVPLDIDEAMTGIADLMNGVVGEIIELRNLFDPSSGEDGEGSLKHRRRF